MDTKHCGKSGNCSLDVKTRACLGKGYSTNYTHTQNKDLSKIENICRCEFRFGSTMEFDFDRMDNIVEISENTGHRHFVLSHVFKILIFQDF